MQEEKHQQFDCFNGHKKQQFLLGCYIDRLVSCTSRSILAFFIMLGNVDWVQRRCNQLQQTT